MRDLSLLYLTSLVSLSTHELILEGKDDRFFARNVYSCYEHCNDYSARLSPNKYDNQHSVCCLGTSAIRSKFIELYREVIFGYCGHPHSWKINIFLVKKQLEGEEK